MMELATVNFRRRNGGPPEDDPPPPRWFVLVLVAGWAAYLLVSLLRGDR